MIAAAQPLEQLGAGEMRDRYKAVAELTDDERAELMADMMRVQVAEGDGGSPKS